MLTTHEFTGSEVMEIIRRHLEESHEMPGDIIIKIKVKNDNEAFVPIEVNDWFVFCEYSKEIVS